MWATSLNTPYIPVFRMVVVFSNEQQVNLLLSGHNLKNSANLEAEFTNEAHIPDEQIFASATRLQKCLSNVCRSHI